MEPRESRLLAALSERARTELLHSAVSRRLRRGSILFLAGEESNRLYVMKSGVVKLSHRRIDGRELMLGLAVPGDLVGEIEAFESRPHELDAIAGCPGEALGLDATCFRRAVTTEPAALRTLVSILGRRCRALSAMLQERNATVVQARLAGKLLHMALLLGREDCGALEFELPLRQADIASFAGTSRESVSKILKRFERDGLLQCRGHKLRIVHPEALERIRCAGRA
ncbi:MAG: Crp/Fnr family transcriptional regulator [Actinomycetota bacterium]